ncbi:MAG: hypothetical protein GXP46_03425 [Deferribacteres bacterium]|nr:hypothetical protein [Deferribacteres bacterium]
MKVNKMIMKAVLLVTLIVLLCTAQTSEAEIIGTWETSRLVSAIGTEVTSQQFMMCFACFDGPLAVLFEDFYLDESYIGQTLTATQSTETDFNAAVDVLTNGKNDEIGYSFGGAYGTSEAYFFFGDSSGANGIDFYGYTIDAISIRINEIELNYDGYMTTEIFQGTLIIEGQSPPPVVPEPKSSVLFVVGQMLLAGGHYIKRRRKKHNNTETSSVMV